MDTYDRWAGQVLVGGFEGATLPAVTRRRLEAGLLGGVILMGRNVESPRQVWELLREVVRAGLHDSDVAPVTSVDQEGGRVARLRGHILDLPPLRSLGAAGDLELTTAASEAMARQLRALGFSVDFAPCLDVDGGPPRSVIGDRSASGSPPAAAAHGAAAVKGFLAAGLCPCGKHFPGHGSTRRDSHHELPVVTDSRRTLRGRDIPPFETGVALGLPLIMTAHVVFTDLDANRPATCSEPIIGGLLRRDLGFAGAVITDDLTMGAVDAIGGTEEVAVAAMAAGVDLLLVCHQEDLQEQVRSAIATEARRHSGFAARVEEAVARSRELRERFRPKPAVDLSESLASAVSAHLAQQIAEIS